MNYISFYIDSLIINKFTLRREDRERLLKLLLNVITTSSEPLFELYRSIFLDQYFDTDKLADLSGFAVSVIVDTFKHPDSEEHIMRNIVSLFSDVVKRVPDHKYLPLIIEAYFSQTNQAILSCKIEEMVTAIGIQSDDKSLITLLNSHSNQPQIKSLIKILIDTFKQEVSQEFLDCAVKVANAWKCSSILAPFLFTKLTYDAVKEHLPLIIIQVKDAHTNIVPLIESIN